MKKNWRAEAECEGTSSDLFFPNHDLSPDVKYRITRAALEVCKICEVQKDCLEYAITNPTLVVAGTWGGLTYKELKRRRSRR